MTLLSFCKQCTSTICNTTEQAKKNKQVTLITELMSECSVFRDIAINKTIEDTLGGNH